jgi:hypothetical protein
MGYVWGIHSVNSWATGFRHYMILGIKFLGQENTARDFPQRFSQNGLGMWFAGSQVSLRKQILQRFFSWCDLEKISWCLRVADLRREGEIYFWGMNNLVMKKYVHISTTKVGLAMVGSIGKFMRHAVSWLS